MIRAILNFIVALWEAWSTRKRAELASQEFHAGKELAELEAKKKDLVAQAKTAEDAAAVEMKKALEAREEINDWKQRRGF